MAAQRGSDEPFNAGDASGRGGLEPFWPMRYDGARAGQGGWEWGQGEGASHDAVNSVWP